MYENFEKLTKLHNKTPYRVSKDTGVAYTVLADWKNGRSTPKHDKLQKIADYFGVNIGYLISGEENVSFDFLNEESKQIAIDAYYNPELKMLFDAAKDVPPEDLLTAIELIKKLKNK
jgi:transcriptional regulator with XRE-family HTH domain